MDLVDSFEPTYWLTQLRVAGDELRLLRAYPGKWQVRDHVSGMDPLRMLCCEKFCAESRVQGMGLCSVHSQPHCFTHVSCLTK